MTHRLPYTMFADSIQQVVLKMGLLLIAFHLSLSVSGQSIQTDFDKKIIYTDSLNLPRNTSADAILSLLSELVQRPGNLLMDNYDIKIEGMSIGVAADVALANLRIADIKKVEVSESSVSNYQKNGQGGSINFVLRSEGETNPNQWGSAGFSLLSPLDVSPQFLMGYKTDKLMVRGVVLGELYDSTSDTQTITYDGEKYVSQGHSSLDKMFRTQLANLYTKYKLSKRDELQFDLSEMCIYNRMYTENNFYQEDFVSQRQSSFSLAAKLKYQHSTARSKIVAELRYNYSPQHKTNVVHDLYTYDSRQNTNGLSGKLEYKNVFLKSTPDKGRQADITVGGNFNLNMSNEDATTVNHGAIGSAQLHVPRNNTYYVSPYMTLSGVFGKLRVKLSCEYQHFKYNIERKDNSHSTISNDITGKLMAEWHFTKEHNLRLILDRSLKRPSADQLYPYRIFVPNQMKYVEGNPDLVPTMFHKVGVDYIFNHRWNAYSNIIVNTSVSYSDVWDIINSKRMKQDAVAGTLGLTQDYISYDNSGRSKISNANLMALYTYKAFSLSVAGNVYAKTQGAEDDRKHYTYFNFSIYPHFTLKDGWNGGAHLFYFSRINQVNGYTGDCAVSSITVGKAWKQFFVYVIEDVSLNRQDVDVTTSGTKRTEKRYNLFHDFMGVGMKYTF